MAGPYHHALGAYPACATQAEHDYACSMCRIHAVHGVGMGALLDAGAGRFQGADECATCALPLCPPAVWGGGTFRYTGDRGDAGGGGGDGGGGGGEWTGTQKALAVGGILLLVLGGGYAIYQATAKQKYKRNRGRWRRRRAYAKAVRHGSSPRRAARTAIRRYPLERVEERVIRRSK